MELLIDRKYVNIKNRDCYSQRPDSNAAYCGSVDPFPAMVKSYGTNFDLGASRTFVSMTAAASGKKETFKILLANAHNPPGGLKLGRTLLNAASNGNTQVLPRLLHLDEIFLYDGDNEAKTSL